MMRRLSIQALRAARRFVECGSEGVPPERALLMRRSRTFALVAQAIVLCGGLISWGLGSGLLAATVMVGIALCVHLGRIRQGRHAELAVNLAIGMLVWANFAGAMHVGGGANPNIVTFPALCVFATGYIAGIRSAALWAAASTLGMGVVVFSSPLPGPAPGIYPAGRGVLFGHHALVLFSAFALSAVARRFEERQSARLAFLARHDPLTGLLNRRALEARIGESLVRAARHGWKIALLFVDLDGFKRVNDARGHHAGDLVLQEIACRIREVTRASDAAGRIGGDEFVVLLESVHEAKDADTYARRLLALAAEPIAIEAVGKVATDAATARVTASIGIACWPEHGSDVAGLMRAADAAMYAAKREGGGRVALSSGTGAGEPTA